MNVMFIGTDTAHRRYIINSVIDHGINVSCCVFQNNSVKPKFEVVPVWAEKEQNECSRRFVSEARDDLDRVSKIVRIADINSNFDTFKNEVENADFIFVSGAGWIKSNLLESIKPKALNIHMGVAEEYRGLDSNLWAWYHYDYSNIGVTLHALDDRLDTGNIYGCETLKIDKKEKIWVLRYFESNIAVKLAVNAVNDLNKGTYRLRNQTKTGRYYSFMPAVIKNQLTENPIYKL